MTNQTPAYSALIDASRKWGRLCNFLDLPHDSSVLTVVLAVKSPAAPFDETPPPDDNNPVETRP